MIGPGRVYATSEGWLKSLPIWIGRKRGSSPFIRWGVTTWDGDVRTNTSYGAWTYHMKGKRATCPKCQ